VPFTRGSWAAVLNPSQAPLGFSVPPVVFDLAFLDVRSGVTFDGMNRVTTWKDRGPAGNDFAYDGTLAHAPLYSASGGPGGTPCLTFDGISQALESTSAVFGAVNVGSLFLVAAFQGSFVNNGGIVDQIGMAPGFGYHSHPMADWDGGNNGNGTITFSTAALGTFYLFEQIADGAGHLDGWLNGTHISTHNANGNASNQRMYLGCEAPGDGAPQQCSICALLASSAALSSGNRAAVETWAAAAYGGLF